ncbi:hypothetical protein E8E14_003990 [Neopestalotiopsis sp. 37M]|nr:hypothetical protein E8E14_003990 [Neopestalotiopsis sp. 37M]
MAAEFVYPTRGNFSTENNNRMINSFDDLYIEYTSSWSALNLTLFCLRDATTSDFSVFNAEDDPIAASGIYHFGSIYSLDSTIGRVAPERCNFKLTRYGDNDDALNGQNFWVSSDPTLPATYSPTSTSTTSATASASPATNTITQTTDTATVPSSSSSSPAATATQASAPHKSSGLSAGAAAGIGVGVALGVLIMAVAILFMFFRRRKAARAAPGESTETPPSEATKSEYYSQHQQQDPQEMEATSPAELEHGQSVPVHRHELSG